MGPVKKINNQCYEILGKKFSHEELISKLLHNISPDRQKRFYNVLNNRSKHIIPVMENIHDTGNINAVMRSAENFGFYKLANIPSVKLKSSARISQGAHKWLQVDRFNSTEECFNQYKKNGYQILVTALADDAVPYEEVDLTRLSLILFGNEKDGASEYALKNSDHRVVIPTVGFTQSFNISVAAAIILSSIYSKLKNNSDILIDDEEKKELLASYLLKHFSEERLLKAYLFNS